MRKMQMISLAFGTVLLGGMLTAGIGQAQATGTAPVGYTDGLDAKGLETMAAGFGYPTKQINTEVGKEKYEVKMEKGGFNIPVGAEISPSKRLIWLTVNLGKPTTLNAEAMLKANASIQPSFYYVTSRGDVMMAIALENRQMKPEIMRWALDKLTADVAAQAPVWQNKSPN